MPTRFSRLAASPLRRDVLACALLGCIVLVLFGRAPLTGGVLAPTDNLFVTPFFASVTPRDFQVPQNPLLLDQVYQFVPWRRFAWETLRAGRLPLWNPESQAGDPFVGTMQSAVFYPINLLLVLLPFEQTFAWSAILKLWVAGTLTYFLARRYRLGRHASIVSAVAFMLSGFLIVWLGHPHTNVAVWLPGILLLDELLLMATAVTYRVRYAALLAILIAVQFTGGHPETSADVLVAAAMYHVLRWAQLVLPEAGSLGSKIRRLALLPGAALVLGAGLASIQLLPFLEWLPLSAEYQARAAESAFQGVHFWKYLFLLPLAVYPNLYGNPTSPLPPSRSLLPWGQNFNEDTLYVGILPLVFAIMALLAWRGRRTPVTVWAVLGGVALGRALHLPVLDWLNRLPVLNLGNPHRQRLVWSMSIAILAGFGAETWWQERADRKARATRHWIALNLSVVTLGGLIAIVGAGILPLMRGRLSALGRHVAEREFAGRVDGAFPLSHYYERVNEALAKALWSFGSTSMYLPGLISAAALAATFWMLRRPAARSGVLPAALVSLTILDLLAFAWRYNPIVPARSFYPRPAAVASMAQDRNLFRFTATGLDLFPDAQMMYGLSDVRSFDFSTRWFSTYVGMIPGTIRWNSSGTTFQDFTSPLLRVLNLRYVFSSRTQSPAGRGGSELVWSDLSAGRLWRLREAQPRSFLVREAIVAQNDSQAVAAIRAAPESIYRRVVLAAPAPAPRPSAPARGGSEASVAGVTMMRYEAERSVWGVRSSSGGYLVTTDAYYPGWRAYLDGIGTPVYRADLAFRAVTVPPGKHLVEYRYEPAWLPVALALEAGSALLAILGLVWSMASARAMRSEARSATP